MSLMLVRAVAAAAILIAGSTLAAQQDVYKSANHDYRVVTVVDALVQPWSIAFLPNGDWLITERPGRLRIVRNGKLLPQAVEGTPKVFTSTQAGLLEVALHPDFATNRFLYLTYSKPGVGDESTTALVRGPF